MTWTRATLLAVVGAVLIAGGAVQATVRGTQASGDSGSAQLGRLYELQAAFHGAATLREGHPASIGARVADVVALWTEDGTLSSGGNTFTGRGEPGTDSCAPGSMTVCDFFANVAPTFFPDGAGADEQHPARGAHVVVDRWFPSKWVSLSPAFKTQIEVEGNTASVAFECHFFGSADWGPRVKIGVEAMATKVGNAWLFSEFVAEPIALPYVPYP